MAKLPERSFYDTVISESRIERMPRSMKRSRLVTAVFGASFYASLIVVACGDDKAPGDGPSGNQNSSSGSSSSGSSSSGSSSGSGGAAGSSSSASSGGSSAAAGGATSGSATGSGGEPGITSTGAGGGAGGGNVDEVCANAWTAEAPAPTLECDFDNLEDSGVTLQGEIDEDMTLESGMTYRLSGPTTVLAGNTLTIEPCVKVLGQSPESILAILPGARIEAEGEPNAPIVFTSSQPAGSRLPGDWGGVIVLGNARTNEATESTLPIIEGLVSAQTYGSANDDLNDESSGTLAYVRIEFVGRDLGGDIESNGLTMGGVGSGTTLHHIMVSNSIDDCFEWFGGTVSAHHLIAFNCDDDMFDTDRGFSGTVQYAFGRQFISSSENDSNGFEMDNQAVIDPITPELDEPKTSARWSNVTLCGALLRERRSVEPVNPRDGMVLRRGVGGAITNALVSGFDTAGYSVRDIPQTTIELTYSRFFRNTTLFESGANEAWFTDQEGNSEEAPERGMCDCWADTPMPFPRERVDGGEPFGDDDKADFMGAFEDASPESNWMAGSWVTWADE